LVTEKVNFCLLGDNVLSQAPSSNTTTIQKYLIDLSISGFTIRGDFFVAVHRTSKNSRTSRVNCGPVESVVDEYARKTAENVEKTAAWHMPSGCKNKD
jgi:hypothetical protein